MVTTYNKLVDIFNDPFLIGFSREFDRLSKTQQANSSASYPPYNVLKHNDDEYTLSLAVAGFYEDNLFVTVEDGYLIVSGKDVPDPMEGKQYLHKGIASRKFSRRFALGEYMEVGETWLEAGILNINIKRDIPESQKPKVIPIKVRKTK